MDEKLLTPIAEASYLTAANAWRYRAILRFFYIQHESMRHHLFPGEVFEHLRQSPHFTGYSEEQLQQDLNQLTDWKNLIARQETSRVTTIEEFKKKRFRYQASPYTVEIERMVRRLEQLGESFGGSLERTLFDRLLTALIRFTESNDHSPEVTNSLWEDIFDAFKKLTENSTDYLAHLQSEKVEELMLTEAFLAYKEALSDYLRNFVGAMQRASLRITDTLNRVPQERIEEASHHLADYYLAVPRLDETPDREEVRARYIRQWQNLQIWFLGAQGRESELTSLQRETHEAIRRVTRFAQRLGERHHQHRSRRRDFQELARRFAACPDIDQAHTLSACIFGLFHTRHIYAPHKDTEDIYAEVWDRPATQLTLAPRVKNYRAKTKANAIRDNHEQKQAVLKDYLQEREAEAQLIASILSNGRIDLAQLGVVEPYLRRTLLTWIERCLANPARTVKTEDGRRFRLIDQKRKIILNCTDGNLHMPAYILEVVE
jgi:uncharacterized protein (TIGR02677 family)